MRTEKQDSNLDDVKRDRHEETELENQEKVGEPEELQEIEDSEKIESSQGIDKQEEILDLENSEDPEELENFEEPEDSDFDFEEIPQEEWNEDDDWEGEENAKPWMTVLVFVGLMAVAAVICVALWRFSHEDNLQDDGFNSSGQIASPSDQGSDSSGALSDSSEQDPASQETNDVQGEDNYELPVTEPVSGTKEMEFTEVQQSVTPKDVVNLRSVPTTLDTESIVTQVENGEILLRTGINEDTGWSEIEYNGQTLYAVSQYLTLDLDYKPSLGSSNPNRVSTIDGRIIIFADCNDWITPKEYVNLRTEPSTSEGDETVSCQLNYGEKAHRTGFSPDSGWSRVEYNGQVLYVVTSLMTITEE